MITLPRDRYRCDVPGQSGLDCGVGQPTPENCTNKGTKELVGGGGVCVYLSEIYPTRTELLEYWDNRARENPDKNTTTDDIHLRELEIKTIAGEIAKISARGSILDIGCGDGLLTIGMALKFPESIVKGIDFSAPMLQLANGNLSRGAGLGDRVTITFGDATRLNDTFGDERFDIIISSRCLINLESSAVQYSVLKDIADHLLPSGYFIATENFVEGHAAMNEARRLMGLPEIPVQWHNKYFTKEDLMARAGKYFKSFSIRDFSSSYYFATRVIYSKMCQMRGEMPDYDHDIHRLATELPPTGEFSPIKLIVMQKR